MDLQKLLGSFFIIGFRGTEIESSGPLEQQLTENAPSGVILFDRCLREPSIPGNIQSPLQLKRLTTQLQHLFSTPRFICVDQEGGLVQRLHSKNGFSNVASAEEMGHADSQTFTHSQAEITARTLTAAGVNVNFAPVVDLNVNHENPIVGKVKRSFSEDPHCIIRHAKSWITVHRQHKIVTCLKHFPGHGSSASDSHLGFVDITSTWSKRELIPYRELISEGYADMVMVGHLFQAAIDAHFPATLSESTVSGLLRNQLDYDGVVITDDMQMKAITDRYGFADSICLALAAGIDMIIIGNNIEYNPNVLTDAVKAVRTGLERGILNEISLLRSLQRIELMKQQLETNDHVRKW